jgi:hypothetical protein
VEKFVEIPAVFAPSVCPTSQKPPCHRGETRKQAFFTYVLARYLVVATSFQRRTEAKVHLGAGA